MLQSAEVRNVFLQRAWRNPSPWNTFEMHGWICKHALANVMSKSICICLVTKGDRRELPNWLGHYGCFGFPLMQPASSLLSNLPGAKIQPLKSPPPGVSQEGSATKLDSTERFLALSLLHTGAIQTFTATDRPELRLFCSNSTTPTTCTKAESPLVISSMEPMPHSREVPIPSSRQQW